MGPRGVHDLRIMIRTFLKIPLCLGHMSREFGLFRTVGLLTITPPDGSSNLNPRVNIFGASRTPIHDPGII
ncbi:unnamed protein product [Prunus armeniaca]